MRIISGTHKGRKIIPPKNISARPTTDKSKEALFNILNNLYEWSKISVLDLFSGTGSISYEFASRGVKSIISVDQDKKSVDFISKTSVENDFNIITFKSSVSFFLKKNTSKFNIIFLDPPYSYEICDYQIIILKLLEINLSQKGIIIVEHSSKLKLDIINGFIERRKYGSNSFSFFKK